MMQRTEADLSEMLGRLLRQRTASAKDLALLTDIDVRSAEGYRAGRHLPKVPAFLRILQTLGSDIAEALTDPEVAEVRLSQEVKDLEKQLAEKRALRDLAGSAPRFQTRAARHEDRPAPQVERGRS